MRKASSTTKESNVLENTKSPVPSDSWTFLTNHSHVLLCLYHNPDMRLRDVARLVGITERMVQKIVADLAGAGYLEITKEGRCNHYRVNADLKLRHPLEMHHTVGELLVILNLISEQPGPKAKPGRSAKSSNGHADG
jgi:DNA-binding transcriptional regulator LsrR (DeoR family)